MVWCLLITWSRKCKVFLALLRFQFSQHKSTKYGLRTTPKWQKKNAHFHPLLSNIPKKQRNLKAKWNEGSWRPCTSSNFLFDQHGQIHLMKVTKVRFLLLLLQKSWRCQIFDIVLISPPNLHHCACHQLCYQTRIHLSNDITSKFSSFSHAIYSSTGRINMMHK